MILNAVAAHAFGPYTTGQAGYDVSYPQCGGFAIPQGSSFGIIGVNGGRPFSFNQCFGSEYSGVANSAYINTGYARSYRNNLTSACRSNAHTLAWQIGCSEAEYSLNHVSVTPSMWWLDVETANSWSSGNLQPNRDTIQGAVDRFSSIGLVGVYSTASAWTRITGGGFTPNLVAGDWVPAASCGAATPFMPNTTVWLTQTVSNNVDVDRAC
ncbi:MAG TPA: hypothetical protein VKE27_12740 [Candidatus Dormibacteraeota bacterium]|nr:hypothetical protein [Candidatus Dormibacteraeota bacterium]